MVNALLFLILKEKPYNVRIISNDGEKRLRGDLTLDAVASAPNRRQLKQ